MGIFSHLRKNEKGQGIIEYALLLAFIAGLAMFLHTGGLKQVLFDTFDSIARVFREDREYAACFEEWRSTSSDALRAMKNAAERLDADRQALTKIAAEFLGKNGNGVHEQMLYFSILYASGNTPQWIVDSVSNNYAIVDSDGWSGVMIPLSYKTNDLDTDGYFWLESNNNVNTVALIAPDAETHMKDTNNNIVANDGTVLPDSKAKTVLRDRIFYSDGMIAQGNDTADNRTIALKVHYDENGAVDKVRIMAQKDVGSNAKNNWGNSDKVADGLDVIVIGTHDNPTYKPVSILD